LVGRAVWAKTEVASANPAAAPAARTITVRLLGAPTIGPRHAETPDLPASSDMIPLHLYARGIAICPQTAGSKRPGSEGREWMSSAVLNKLTQTSTRLNETVNAVGDIGSARSMVASHMRDDADGTGRVNDTGERHG
jgi:hypothetical protein